VRTEDIARFGLLYLQKGEWQGKQLVPAKWVTLATSRQTSTGSAPTSDWDQGYGYQFWQSRHGYRGDGAFGQFCMVLPELDAVVAITSGGRDMQAVMNTVWDRLLPAMQAAALPANDADHKKLQARLSKLEVRRVEGKASPRLPASISGKVYSVEANEGGVESLSLDWRSQPGKATFTARVKGVDQIVTCAKDTWVRGSGPIGDGAPQLFAAQCAWSSKDTLEIKTVLPQTPFYYTGKARFTSTELVFETGVNVEPKESKRFVGHAK
jgi:hypothetical protein